LFLLRSSARARFGLHAIESMATLALLIVDDLVLGPALKHGLEQEKLAVDLVADYQSADAAVQARRYDVVVLDFALPGTQDAALLRIWRARGETTPVIVLTARAFVADRVRLLDMGADDYLVKPFELIELSARIRALVRRAANRGGETLEFGPVQLAPDNRKVTLHGADVDLTNREFLLLEALLRNRSRVLTRRQLEDLLYGRDEEVESNAVEVHIHHLRRKLGRNLIETVRGVGYRLRQ
jgi:two-component system, OmpR family, response regulator QseB